MNPVAEDILSYYGMTGQEMNDYSNDEELMHYGTPRHSGRFPFGSGKDPYQHSIDFLGRVEELRKNGFTYTDDDGKTWSGDMAIAKSMGLSSTQFRTELALATDERRMGQVTRVKALKEKGLGASAIGREMGISESTVRSLLNERSEARMKQAKDTAAFIAKELETKGMIDVGPGVELELNISREKLKEALYILEREGYPVYSGRIPQVTNPGKHTTQTVVCLPGTEHKEIYQYDKVKTLHEYASHDDGKTFDKFQYPASLDSKRLKILLADEVGPDGERGVDKDGIVQIRRGVPDLSLGDSHYAQVRILVDGNKYIKGMAVYSDNMPDGVDVLFNSNKTSYDKALKDITNDPENPFGSLIKPNGQSYYTDASGNKKLSLINKRADEGDWTEWQDALPSQFLGKQTLALAQKQLDLARADKNAEYEAICALENPTVKKHFLEDFANNCDSAAVHLKAAALPGQKYHVIVPVNTLKDNEIYAPQYETGTKLALVRYPHGGTFEIPILTVNNKHKPAEKLIGSKSIDAVGINKNIADRLSGADFDGDTVMCIPTHDRGGKVKITSTPALKGLEGFDPRMTYPEREGMRYMKDPKTGKDTTQMEMGIISNLITDMTLGGANHDELARAVRHSMVVIDAGKHKLDYKQSEKDNNVSALKKDYQRTVDEDGNIVKVGGASTILSRAKGEYSVLKRQGTPKINIKGEEWYDPSRPEGALIYKTSKDAYYPDRKYDKTTGEITIRTTDGKKVTYKTDDADARARYNPVKRVNEETGEVTFTDSTGTINYKVRERTQKSTKMAETDDAYSLVSSNQYPMERVYADYANDMKALANKARVELYHTGKTPYNADAAKTYKEEVRSLDGKLKNALLNAGRERAAQRAANVAVSDKKAADPNMKKDDISKAGQQALTAGRNAVGAVSRRDRNIPITDKEWEAIQAGAVSEHILKQILNNTDPDRLRQLATPRATNTLSTAKINRIKSMSNSNYTIGQIARALGVSTSVVAEYI